MTKRSLAALAASILMSVAAIDGFVAPQLAHAQASGAAGTSAQAAAPSAAPAPAAEPAPPPAPATTEAVENPYGLGALWKNGDFVARFVLILLVIMSMGSWYIMITKFLEQLRANRRAKLADAQLWTAPSLAEGAKLLDEASPFRFIAETAIEAGEHHEDALLEAVDRNTWIDVSVERSITNVSNRMQDEPRSWPRWAHRAVRRAVRHRLGIYHALTAIGIAGQASIDKVAGPVGEALIMTAIGLAVAVPAVLGYNFLVRRNKSVMERVRNFGAQLHTVLLAGNRRPVRASSSPAAASLAN